jgi:diguanylate cyclase (GGDEF)-like protein
MALIMAMCWLWLLPAAHAMKAPVLLNPPPIQQSIGGLFDTLEDPAHRLSLKDALSTETGWHQVHGPALNFGFSKSWWWARITLLNPSEHPEAIILDLGTSLIDDVDVYVLAEDGRLVQHHELGNRLPFAQRPIQLRTLAVPLNLEAGQTLQIYLRFKSHDGFHDMAVPTLWQPRVLLAYTQTNDWLTGTCVGVMFTVLIYNILLFASTRILTFAYYAAFSTFLIWWILAFQGMTLQYLWPQSPHFDKQALLGAGYLAYALMSAFALQYGKGLRYLSTRMLRVIHTLMGLIVLCIIPLFWGCYMWPFAIGSSLGVVLMSTLFLAAFMAIKKGSHPARYMLMAFTALSTGVASYYLMVLDVLPADIPINVLIPLCAAIQSMVLALGLGFHLQTLRTQKRDAVQRALDAQTALTTQLEALVSRRTAELEQANQQLANLSVTDELTGVLNRRQFNKDVAQALSQHARHGTPMALCLLDVDHFKPFNDHYGHQAGDTVLQRVCRTIESRLNRANDRLYRIGGEEFAILLDINGPSEQACSFVEKVVRDIAESGIPHESSPMGCVTVSGGLVILCQERGHTPDVQTLYDTVDGLLYQAKRAGRNQLNCLVMDTPKPRESSF